MLCLYCGAKNERFSFRCSACNRDISTPDDVLGHLGQIMRVAEKSIDNKVSNEDFQSVVDRMEDITNQVASDMSIPVNDDTAVEDVVNKAQKGLFITMGAIKEFKKYLKTDEKNHIRRGIAMIKQAYDISRRSYKEMENMKKEKEGSEGKMAE